MNRFAFNAAAPRKHWRRGNLAKWRRSRGDARLRADAALLSPVLLAAKDLPVAQNAIRWALAHGIEFIVDHTVKDAYGYYHPGTGVVALSARMLQNACEQGGFIKALGVLVHEIRHAWQDYHDLLYIADKATVAASPFARDLVIEGLYESDAEAHAALVRAECNIAHMQGRIALMEALPRNASRDRMIGTWRAQMQDLQEETADAGAFLREHMLQWYAPFNYATVYGRALRQTYGYHLGLRRHLPQHGFEYRPPRGIAAVAPPDVHRREVLEKYGRSFAGVNYMAGMDRAFFMRHMLSPASASFVFPEDEPVEALPCQLSREIRRAQLRAKYPARQG